MKKVTPGLAEILIDELINAKHDAMSLAKAHKLRPEAVAEWIADPATQRLLANYCRLGDTQAQLTISRFRPHAAQRLVLFATNKDKTEAGAPVIDPDLARRACVDLLKVDLTTSPANPAPSADATPDTTTAQGFRESLYVEVKKIDT